MTNSELQPLPVGNSDFQALRLCNQIYVDKTELVFRLARLREKFFLARPRRFGKSLLISTFESLFKYGLRDFKGLAIEKLWTDKNEYKVVRLDFVGLKDFSSLEAFNNKLDELLERRFRTVGFQYDPNSHMSLMSQLSDWLDIVPPNSLVLLIDEYDAPLTASLNDSELFDSVRKSLARFYAEIKSNDRAIRFSFMTGITKFSKTSIFPELNTFTDLTLRPAYGTLLGYTQKEVEKYFCGYLTRSAEILGVRCNDMMEELIKYYGGYCFERTATKQVFSPWSILQFFSAPEDGLCDYWIESGARPSVLLQYMKSHYLRNPEEYGAVKSISLSSLSDSSDLKDLTDIGLLTQAGYLTIKSVEENEIAFVDYPNLEVRKAMAKLYLSQLLSGKTARQVGAGSIAKVLASEAAESVYHDFNKLFKAIGYQDYPVQKESQVVTIVQVYMAGSGLQPRIEVYNHLGRSDLEVKAGNRHWVFEFKVVRDGTNAEKKLTEAVEQMRRKDYGNPQDTYELKRMALVFSVVKRQFVHWQEI